MKKNFEQIKEEGRMILEEIDRINELMENNPTPINESSLSRVWSASEKFDVAAISACHEKNINCIHQRETKPEGEVYTKRENNARTAELYAVLINKGYHVTRVRGSYIENFGSTDPNKIPKEVKENSFFVVNRNQDPEFFNTIKKLGKYFCQDSVMLKPLGEHAYLYGTNHHNFPGLDTTYNLGEYKGGNENEFMSRIGGRPYFFGEEDASPMTRGHMSHSSKKTMEEISKLFP